MADATKEIVRPGTAALDAKYHDNGDGTYSLAVYVEGIVADVDLDIEPSDLTVHPTGLSTVATGEIEADSSAVQFASVAAKYVRIKARTTNAASVYIGLAGVTVPDGETTTTCGFELAPGDDTGWIPISNLNLLYIIGSSDADGATYMVLA